MTEPTHSTPTFGEPVDGIYYEKRNGAYAIITDGNKIATVHIPQGYSLPGGGIDGNEIAEEALAREIIEELGWTVKIIRHVWSANQYHFSPDGLRGFLTFGTFYQAKYIATSSLPTEPDHTLVWLTLEEAQSELRFEYMRRAVNQYIKMSKEYLTCPKDHSL